MEGKVDGSPTLFAWDKGAKIEEKNDNYTLCSIATRFRTPVSIDDGTLAFDFRSNTCVTDDSCVGCRRYRSVKINGFRDE